MRFFLLIGLIFWVLNEWATFSTSAWKCCLSKKKYLHQQSQANFPDYNVVFWQMFCEWLSCAAKAIIEDFSSIPALAALVWLLVDFLSVEQTKLATNLIGWLIQMILRFFCKNILKLLMQKKFGWNNYNYIPGYVWVQTLEFKNCCNCLIFEYMSFKLIY